MPQALGTEAIVAQCILRTTIKFTIETELEDDGRIIAEVTELPGVLVYGQTEADVIAKAQALALRVLADQVEHGEAAPALLDAFFAAVA